MVTTFMAIGTLLVLVARSTLSCSLQIEPVDKGDLLTKDSSFSLQHPLKA